MHVQQHVNSAEMPKETKHLIFFALTICMECIFSNMKLYYAVIRCSKSVEIFKWKHFLKKLWT